MSFSGRQAIPQQPACPHSVTPLRSKDEFPHQADKDICPICYNNWFSIADDGGIIEPFLISHCDHVVCRQCFTIQRANTLACLLGWCNGHAPLNPAHCRSCRDWQSRDLHMPEAMMIALIVRDDMIEDILAELTELRNDSRFFYIPPAAKKVLTKHWRTYLHNFGGQFHRSHDLAELLDPFRGAEIDHKEVLEVFDTGSLLQPMPDPVARGYLAPDLLSANEFPNGVEPWISTVLRTIFLKMSDEEGTEVPVSSNGVYLRRHHPEDFVDEDGTWHEEWPIKKILQHRFGVDGEVEYKVQWLGHTQSDGNEWRCAEEFGWPNIWKKYNRLHGLPIPDSNDANDSENSELSDEDDEIEDAGEYDETEGVMGDESYEEEESEDEMEKD